MLYSKLINEVQENLCSSKKFLITKEDAYTL